MSTVFRDRKRVLMVDIMQQGTTIMNRTIQNKRHGMLTFGEVLLHDNARPHTAARTRALLEHFNWELFDRHPYSPDLASSDFHLFTYLKNWFRLQRFNNNEELIKRCQNIAELTGGRLI
jgi:histone-lysine N-methyltransferase SETMAR